MPVATEWIRGYHDLHRQSPRSGHVFRVQHDICHIYRGLFFALTLLGQDVCTAEWDWMTKGIVVFFHGHILQLKHFDFCSDVC